MTFTCVVSTTNITTWIVNSGGNGDSCTYRRNNPLNTENCGPGDIFTSSVTDVNGDPRNSSLSVDSITSDLSGTSVTCSDGNDNTIGSKIVCVIGEGLISVSSSTAFLSHTQLYSVPEFPALFYKCIISIFHRPPPYMHTFSVGEKPVNAFTGSKRFSAVAFSVSHRFLSYV